MNRFGSSLWLIPLSILIHNLEEYPRIVAYARRHGVGIDRRQMGIAVLLATLLPIPVVAAASQQPTNRRRMQLALAIPALMALNAGTHMAQTIALQDYSPGTITGITVNMPLAIWLYREALREGVLTAPELRRAALLGCGMLTPAALILLLLGWLIDHLLQPGSV